MNLRNSLAGFLLMALLSACALFHSGAKTTEPPLPSLEFAGWQWQVKQAEYPMGPGGNYFSGRPENVWLDEEGHLHLRIAEVDSLWRSAEVISQELTGYGRYSFTVEGNLSDLAPQVVFGLFTWDDHNFDSDGNSEIDFEFSRWGHPMSETLLHYSVHPLAHTRLYLERRHSPPLPPGTWDGISTHVFYWAPDFIIWESYRGSEARAENLVARHQYNANEAPARRKYIEGRVSEPFVIPRPGKSTRVHINLWLFGPHKRPRAGQPQEVIIRDFEYQPNAEKTPD